MCKSASLCDGVMWCEKRCSQVKSRHSRSEIHQAKAQSHTRRWHFTNSAHTWEQTVLAPANIYSISIKLSKCQPQGLSLLCTVKARPQATCIYNPVQGHTYRHTVGTKNCKADTPTLCLETFSFTALL